MGGSVTPITMHNWRADLSSEEAAKMGERTGDFPGVGPVGRKHVGAQQRQVSGGGRQRPGRVPAWGMQGSILKAQGGCQRRKGLKQVLM